MGAWASDAGAGWGAVSGVVVPAYTPFVDPLDLHGAWWVLLVPLAVLISVTYKAVRLSSLRHFAREVAIMSTQILAGMVALGVALYLFIMLIVPAIAPMPGS